MFDGIYNVRPGERRDVWLAFAVLSSFVGAFAMLETARDALFLARIDAAHLPWVYLAIAIVSLALVEAQSRAASRLPSGRSALTAALGAAAVVTALFFFGLRGGVALLYALYVWSGVVSTIVLVRFWTLLGELFSVTQAKRVYGFIGIGSVLGAIAGSGAASLIARALAARWLLLFAAGGFLSAALLSIRFRETARPDAADVSSDRSDNLRDCAKLLWRQPYAKRVAGIMLLSACALTVADFIFKQALSRAVPPSELGSTLASAYFGLNVLSLLAQVAFVGVVIRRLGLLAALGVLPLLLLLGGGLMIGVGGLVAALAIKGSDGALRHTLHRTATELLFVPLPTDVRRKLRAFIDVVGQRGGQALASALILVLLAMHAPPWVVALALVGICGGWLALVFDLRVHYLGVFRGQLRPGSALRAEVLPDLDVRSLETLVAGLDGKDDDEVIAALDSLDREGKGRFVPALTLYHPSPAVVERVLCLFSRTGRTNALHIIDRILVHELPRVRSAAVAARSAIAHDQALLRTLLSTERSDEVRATIAANLIAAGDIDGGERERLLDDLLVPGKRDACCAMVNAIARHRAGARSDVLIRLANSREPTVRIAVARAIVALERPELVPSLLPLLADEATRREAERALVGFGELGLGVLGRALEDGSLGGAILWHVPKAIRRFEPTCAVRALERGLRVVKDGMLRYRLIRALEQLVVHNPDLTLDRALLERTLRDTVQRTFGFLALRVALERGAGLDASRATPGHELLLALLADKERHAIGRIFRLLGLLHPREDFAAIYAGVVGARREARASSLELIENLLSEPLRQAIVGLVDDQPIAARLRAGARFFVANTSDYRGVLDKLLESGSESIVDVTVFHIGELGLTSYRPRIATLRPRPDVTLALDRLSAPPPRQEASHAW